MTHFQINMTIDEHKKVDDQFTDRLNFIRDYFKDDLEKLNIVVSSIRTCLSIFNTHKEGQKEHLYTINIPHECKSSLVGDLLITTYENICIKELGKERIIY